MKTYIIDGNNLIGKISSLNKVQKKDKQASREQLAFIVDRYFFKNKARATLHFDGYQNLPIKVSKLKIIYSENLTADERIKDQIESTKNPKNLIVVTSDNNLKEFAKVCRSAVISSEEFGIAITKNSNEDEEKSKIDELKNQKDEFLKLFRDGKKNE